jgi:hypothetical protein
MIQLDLEPYDNGEDWFTFKLDYQFTMVVEDASYKLNENSVK